ncbi:MAG: hypothetical protein JNK05_24015 [Myxococcales bacterium]|nr:hypothetical protein [Myxococcales bacterium]
MSNPQQPWGAGAPPGYGAQQPNAYGGAPAQHGYPPPQGAGPYGQPAQPMGAYPSTGQAVQASLGATANNMKGAAVRLGAIIGLSVLVAGGIGAKAAFDKRPSLVFLHNVRASVATVTVNGTPRGTVSPAEVLQIPVEPGNYTVATTFANGETHSMTFTVPQRESFFEGYRAVAMLGAPFRYASVTVRYPSYGMRPAIAMLSHTPQSLVVLPAGASRETVNTGFPRSVTTRRGRSVVLTHYCPVTADGDVPCLN